MSLKRSPYTASLSEVVQRFALSVDRIHVLRGFLEYRAALYKAGIKTGFQWLDGSFVEDKETLLGLPPSDVDVVTFFHLPEGLDQATFAQSHSSLYNPTSTKAEFRVDDYGFVLGSPLTPDAVRRVAYWYSMWSHRRNGFLWKGFVQVDISSSEDDLASVLLSQIERDLPLQGRRTP